MVMDKVQVASDTPCRSGCIAAIWPKQRTKESVGHIERLRPSRRFGRYEDRLTEIEQ